MPEYAVFLELYFIRNSAEDTDLDEISEEEMMARNHSFDYTDNNIGDIMEYVKTFSPYEVADNFCGLYDIVEGSEKWIHTNDGKLTLTFHIKMDTEETIEEIRDMFLNDSLEDGPYEGVCINFGKIEFMGEDSDGFGKINFNYDLLYIPEDVNFEVVKEDLEKTIGELLNIILEDIMLREAETNETGNSDTQQSTE